MVRSRSAAGSRSGERGQLILIAAIVVAAAILGGVVLLNTIHSSPDVSAQTDAQSVSDADRTTAGIHSDLGDLFMASGTDETGFPVPYADEDEFGDEVDEYSEQYTELISTNRSAIASVELVDWTEGTVAYSNESSDEFVDNEQNPIIEDADALPRLHMSFEDYEGGDLTVVISSGTNIEFEFTENHVEYDVQATNIVCDGNPREVDLVYGAGYIETDESYCVVELPDLGSTDVNFDLPNDEPDGQYAVSGENVGDCADPCETGEIVNPEFELIYQDPSVSFESELKLFKRGER